MKYLFTFFLSVLLFSCSSNDNADLKVLELSSGKLVPDFSSDVTEYSVISLNSLRPVKVNAIAEDASAKVSYNIPVNSDNTFKLDKIDKNKFIEITVTSKSRSTKTYKIRTVPKNFPELKVKVNNSPSDDYLYLANFSLDRKFRSEYGKYIMIVDNFGKPVYYRNVGLGSAEFKKHIDGTYSYFNAEMIKMPEIFGSFIRLDENFNIIDTHRCDHGYTDMHDFEVLPNGNIIMLGVEIKEMDFSKAGGSNKIKTWEYFIQEMDKNKKVVSNWRTFDYYKPSDIISAYDLKKGELEHGVNCNALWFYPNGDLLLCSRKIDEITRIDWETGKILWRMGGVQSKNNQFKFINDPKNGFSHQHTASVLENGNILLMDNGNFNKKGVTKEDIFFVPETRICEYKVDELAKTAELVWQYQMPGMFVPIMGSAQRLTNGNTLMCWTKDSPAFTEVDSKGNKVWEMDLPKGFQCYSAYKFKK